MNPFRRKTAIVLINILFATLLATGCSEDTSTRPGGFSIEFQNEWGGEGSDPGLFNQPKGIAIGPDGSVYVSDTSNHRIQKFAPTGEFLLAWGSLGSAEGEFSAPWDVAVSNAGYVYVADRDNHRIQRFTDTGAFLGAWGRHGTAPGRFSHPRGITVAPDGSVLVVEGLIATDRNRLQRFTPSGELLGEWGRYGTADGEFDFTRGSTETLDPELCELRPDEGPTLGFAGISKCIGLRGVASAGARVYVADIGNRRIQVFSLKGAFIAKWTGDAAPFRFPQSVAVTPGGLVLVADESPDERIKFFDEEGAYLFGMGGWGDGVGEFGELPIAIAVSATGFLYVCDAWNSRVQRFSIDAS